MAVEAVVSVVIQKVTHLLIQESVIFDRVVDQVEDIRLELRAMRGFLTDAEERQKDDPEAKSWVRKYLETIYNVEDMVESYVLTLARKKREMGVFQNYGLFFHDLVACHNVRRKMKQIEKKIKKLNEEMPDNVEDASLRSISLRRMKTLDQIDFENSDGLGNTSFSASNFSQTKWNFSGSYKEDGSDFVGFKDVEETLKKRLTSDEHGKIIGVVGPLGSGKTTLVKRIYNRKSISEKFVCHAWLNVYEERDFKDLLLRLWNQVNEKEPSVTNEEQQKGKLHEFLQGKKYLIILDDARKERNGWSKLIDTLPEVDGSKVVLITRNKEIGESRDRDYLNLRSLGNRENWELFLKNLCQGPGEDSGSWDSFYSKLCQEKALQYKIFKISKGLPFNIVLLGGFLSTKKMSCEEWTRLCNLAMKTEIWLLSYSDLPAQYKLCLLYLTLFPKEFDISVRRIIRLWLAEGFLQLPPGLGLCEDMAEECFNDLVKRNLIKISKLRSDGGPRKCHLTGFLHEKLSPIAQEISLFHIHQKSAEQEPPPPDTNPSNMSAEQRHEPPPDINPSEMSVEQFNILVEPGVRRIVEYADIKDYTPGSNLQNLRSYLSFNSQRYDNPAKEVGNFLQKITGSKGFGLLRVLDLEGVYKPKLPTTLKHLFQLRYLGLRWTFLDSLPKSVGDLPYLETLDLKRTYINTLPSSVWKLKHLRHLYLPKVRLDMKQPASQLLTLWGLIIDDVCNMKDGLNQLHDLRELGITCQLNEFGELMSWIQKLPQLQSLSLTSKNEMGCPSNLSLESLSEMEKLSHLELVGKLNNPLNKDQLPPQLKVLTLSVSHLKEDPMGILSALRNLSVLRLQAKSYLGQKMNCPQNGFRMLRVFKLWMLDELEDWIVQQGGMPNIKELNIRCCQKLKEIPPQLMQRATLEKLIVTSMPKVFEEKVRKKISEHTLLKVNSYEFTPLPWEKEPDLWK